jgi:hypothetical protein
MVDLELETEGEAQPQWVSRAKENFLGRKRDHKNIPAVAATIPRDTTFCQSMDSTYSF